MNSWRITFISCSILCAGLVALCGCKTREQFDTKVPNVQEFTVPPNDPRYTNPPTAEYKRRPPKEDFKPSMGAGDPSMGMQQGPRGPR